MKTFCSILDLIRIIKEPTRVCESSQSIIDLILVSDVQKICQQGVIECGMSDNMATYCSRKVSKQQVNGHNTLNIHSRNVAVTWHRLSLPCATVQGAIGEHVNGPLAAGETRRKFWTYSKLFAGWIQAVAHGENPV